VQLPGRPGLFARQTCIRMNRSVISDLGVGLLELAKVGQRFSIIAKTVVQIAIGEEAQDSKLLFLAAP
jgi:hypothetical protein